jgi:hypothetical protein
MDLLEGGETPEGEPDLVRYVLRRELHVEKSGNSRW